MVKTRMATYLPRFRVGASSEVTARAVSSQIPAPQPEMVMPAMNWFISLAVPQMIMAMINMPLPASETYRRPTRSEIEPTEVLSELGQVQHRERPSHQEPKDVSKSSHWTDTSFEETYQMGKRLPKPTGCRARTRSICRHHQHRDRYS